MGSCIFNLLRCSFAVQRRAKQEKMTSKELLKEEVEVLLANKHSGDMEKIDQFELKAQFTEEFFEEFQFDAEFRSIFESMARGLTPYEAIEHLCKSKKELFKSLERAIENTPQRIIISPERFEQLKGEIEQ